MVIIEKKNNMNNLIAISGKIGAGKDSVGNIIRYLSHPKYKEDSNLYLLKDIEDFLTHNSLDTQETYQIKKFAGKLKDIVCILLGCSRVQLEDRVFKNKKLGEDWWYWKIFTNKNDITKYLLLDYKESNFETLKEGGNQFILEKLTPRKILQLLGTEAGRQIIHPNIWVSSLFSDYKASETHKVPRYYDDNNQKGLSGYEGIWEYPKWLITDCRFPNEADAVKRRGGIIIRVNRSNQDLEGLTVHPSETSLDDYKDFDFIINNNGSEEDLINIVKRIYFKS